MNELQELSKTYHQVSLEKTRALHHLLTHNLPLYFPEIEPHFHSCVTSFGSSGKTATAISGSLPTGTGTVTFILWIR